MTTDEISFENEPTCIGKLIEQELRRQDRTVTWLSRKIHCDRRNIYDIFSRSFIDTGLLWRISKALNTNFFEYYAAAFHVQRQESSTLLPRFAASEAKGIPFASKDGFVT